MAFDYTEENFRAIRKIQNIHPYFNLAIYYLSDFSDSVRLSEAKSMFEIPRQTIKPRIVFLDDPYPIVQCKERIFFRENRIEISYGIFAILGMLGAFENAVNDLKKHEEKEGSISTEAVLEMDISNLTSCIRDVLNYLKQSYDAFPETVPPIPQMTLSTDLLNDSLKFIVGHELSHYLDPYYSYDVRNRKQTETINKSLEFLRALRGTPFKRHADQFLNDIEKACEAQNQFYTYWSEEMLADLEAYYYLCSYTSVGILGERRLMAVSLAFVAMKLVEYFESALVPDSPTTYSIPIKWREVFLQFLLYKKHYYGYDTFNEFLSKELGIFEIINMLFQRTMLALKSENEESGKNQEDTAAKKPDEAETTGGEFSEKLLYCEEMIGRLRTASAAEAEGIAEEMEKVYKECSSSEWFCKVFPPEKMADVLYGIGCVCYWEKEYEKAYEWFYSATTYYETAKNPYTRSAAECYFQLGRVCYDTGNYNSASLWAGQAWFIQERVLGLPFEDSVDIYSLVVKAYIGDGRNEEAASLAQRILDCTRDDTVKIEMFRNMGIICDKCGDNEGALDWFFKAIAMNEKLYGPENMDKTTLYNSVGTIYSNMGAFDDAEKYLMSAYRIKKHLLEPDDPSLANSMHNLGTMEARRGDWQKALRWFQKALKIRQTVLGGQHPLVADTFFSMSGAYYVKQDYVKSLEYANLALAIYEKKLRKNHTQIKNTKRNIEILKELAGAHTIEADSKTAVQNLLF